MASTPHTYGPTCSLYTESNAFTRRASEVSASPPKIKAHFFYSSALTIDDPLSPLPTPSNAPATTPSKNPPRPFSVYDNAALEAAWQDLQNSEAKKSRHGRLWEEKPKGKQPQNRIYSSGAQDEGVDEDQSWNDDGHPEGPEDNLVDSGKNAEISEDANEERNSVIDTAAGTAGKGLFMQQNPSPLNGDIGAITPPAGLDDPQTRPYGTGDPHLMLCDDPDHIPFDYTMPVGSDEIGNDEFESGISKKKHRRPFHRRATSEKPIKDKEDSSPSRRLSLRKRTSVVAPGSSPSQRDTTGTPFLRIPSRRRISNSRSPERVSNASQTDGADSASDDERPRSSHQYHAFHHKSKKVRKAFTPVGISRLHLVEMPDLQMKPIYWSPIHDISSVVRGTWFYKDTMYPVESEVANLLEEGYEYMKPWTVTYTDELNSCMDNGAEAELKIVYKLWPEDESRKSESRPSTRRSPKPLLNMATEQLTSDEQALKDAVVGAASPENKAAGTFDSRDSKDESTRPMARSSVIYANSKDAQILRPGLLPSVARGRRPLGAIRKGRIIGVPVVRGFDHKAWEKFHPSKEASKTAKARDNATISRSGTALLKAGEKPCDACLAEQERPKATDLVLVIHGIGQKLSERVESYHFTHAINAFRRQINVELGSGAVQPWLRHDLDGIMVLPINWRSTLTLDDGGPRPNPNHREENSSTNQYTLKDITAETIPAVRNLISDVMLDIPYYLSHHKPKMIEAVIKEANRVYRLWCMNNPGFHETGRVHLIAHSLGSVMALDILSKQPTKLPKRLELKSRKVHDDMFEFDTKSLFFCGSPAGFFLLLNRAPLLPRRGRDKQGAEGEYVGTGVVGEAGTYGCLAVDNLYNVMHYNDPIAYRVNACVDVDYATSLQPASVPSATSSWMQTIGSVFRSKAIPSDTTPSSLDTFPRRPTTARLPTTMEMETHDFTREEAAEKRMYLLNDNGQIDYILHSGGGPLEIQYLNMLSAHSSYWILQDFARFLVVEIGRKAGKGETLAAMRAVKKVWGKK